MTPKNILFDSTDQSLMQSSWLNCRTLLITVLDCGPSGGGGAPEKVSCPADSLYAYCINTGNDGIGQDVSLGVLKFDAKTDPNGLYTSCPSGRAT